MDNEFQEFEEFENEDLLGGESETLNFDPELPRKTTPTKTFIDEEGEEREVRVNQGIGNNVDDDELKNIIKRNAPEEAKNVNTKGWSLDDFIAKEIGAKEGVIKTGIGDEEIEYEISELNDKQKIAILKNHYSQMKGSETDSELSEDEETIIKYLREGKLEDLYNDLSKELGVTNQSPTPVEQLGENEIIEWTVRNSLPDASEDEIEEEIQVFKDSPNYEKKLNAAKQTYSNLLEQQLQAQEYKRQQQAEKARQQTIENITSMAQEVDSIMDFEIDDEIKNEALASIIETNERGTTEIQDLLSNEQGILELALIRKSLPRINDYVAQLHEEIERLKTRSTQTEQRKTFIADQDVDKKNNMNKEAWEEYFNKNFQDFSLKQS